jgi:hypothetical protein
LADSTEHQLETGRWSESYISFYCL